MKKTSWLRYLVYMALIVGLIYLEVYMASQSTCFVERFGMNIVIIPLLIKVCLGLILGFDHFIRQFKKAGPWKFNIPKILFMVIPSLYLGLSMFIFYRDIPLLSLPIEMMTWIINDTSISPTSLFQLICGYSLITSFYKESIL